MKSKRLPGSGWLACSKCHHPIIDHDGGKCVECGCERQNTVRKPQGMDLMQLPDMEMA